METSSLSRIAVVGAGYVGLVTAACFAHLGNAVVLVENNHTRLNALKSGETPIHEEGLPQLLAAANADSRIDYTDNLELALKSARILFIAVGTPPRSDGSADTTFVEQLAHDIGKALDHNLIIATKSTVPVGTTENVERIIQAELDQRGIEAKIHAVSNPEFLKEGTAVADFLNPDRVILGGSHQPSLDAIANLYEPLLKQGSELVLTDARTAELTKYASNAMLAARISFMNELANLADGLGANIDDVKRGVGADPRIGPAFLNAGVGYGGMCFPKDVKALVATAEDLGQIQGLSILAAIEGVNQRQKHVLVDKITQRFGDVQGRTFGLWGLAFKPNTDDVREAPSLDIINDLLAHGARVKGYDPVATPNARAIVTSAGIEWADSAFEAAQGVDALLIVTEWPEFAEVNLTALRSLLKHPMIFDGRNIFDPAHMRDAGFEYYSIGRGTRIPTISEVPLS